MMHALTIRSVPNEDRLRHMKARARRSGRFLRVVLREGTANTKLMNLADQVILRRQDGSLKLMKNRFPDAPTMGAG